MWRRQVRPSSASTVVASNQANCSPIHIRGPATEGKIGAARLAGRLEVEAVGFPARAAASGPAELFWLGPPPRVAMQQSWADQAHRPHLHAHRAPAAPARDG